MSGHNDQNLFSLLLQEKLKRFFNQCYLFNAEIVGFHKNVRKKNLQHVFVVVVLVFYGPSTLFRSFWVQSVNLSTMYLGKPPRQFLVLSAHSITSNRQLPFFNQRKGENGRRNYFITNLYDRMLPDVRIKPVTIRIPGRRASN